MATTLEAKEAQAPVHDGQGHPGRGPLHYPLDLQRAAWPVH